jgi:hypothetical protein
MLMRGNTPPTQLSPPHRSRPTGSHPTVVLPLIALASPEWSMNDIAGKVGSSRWLIMGHQVHPDPRATDAADTLTPQKCFVLCLFWGTSDGGSPVTRNRVPDREEQGKPRNDARRGRCHPLE